MDLGRCNDDDEDFAVDGFFGWTGVVGIPPTTGPSSVNTGNKDDDEDDVWSGLTEEDVMRVYY